MELTSTPPHSHQPGTQSSLAEVASKETAMEKSDLEAPLNGGQQPAGNATHCTRPSMSKKRVRRHSHSTRVIRQSAGSGLSAESDALDSIRIRSHSHSYSDSDSHISRMRVKMLSKGFKPEFVDLALQSSGASASTSQSLQPQRIPSVDAIFTAPDQHHQGRVSEQKQGGRPLAVPQRMVSTRWGSEEATLPATGAEGSQNLKTNPQVEEKIGKLRFLDCRSWLEAADTKHRYGKALMKYFRHWQMLPGTIGNDKEDFFTWIDFGEGRAVDLPWYPRRKLESQRVKYMNEEERTWFEVKLEGGVCTWATTGEIVHTPRSGVLAKLFGGMCECCLQGTGVWIFVLGQEYVESGDPVRRYPVHHLYVGQKVHGRLHHSSFTAGAPTLAAGNIHIVKGRLQKLTPRSGHYRPEVGQWLEELRAFLIAGGISDVATVIPKRVLRSVKQQVDEHRSIAVSSSRHTARPDERK